MEVQFFKYLGARNVLDKTLPDPVTLTGSITRFDLRTPVIVTRENIKEYTMCFVPHLGRYYFIENVSYDGDKAYMNLTCDVLMTFNRQIKDATGTVYSTDRPRKYDDNYKPVCDVRPRKEKITFPVSGLTENGSIVMITLKGNI